MSGTEQKDASLRLRLLVATVRGAISGAVHASVPWLIEQLAESN